MDAGPGSCMALDGVSLSVEPKQFVALSGPSGSGKSTLINIMGGLDRPDAGRVQFENRDLAELTDAERSEIRLHRIGFVFQDPHLVPVLSVAENIELPLLFRRDNFPQIATDELLARCGTSGLGTSAIAVPTISRAANANVRRLRGR